MVTRLNILKGLVCIQCFWCVGLRCNEDMISVLTEAFRYYIKKKKKKKKKPFPLLHKCYGMPLPILSKCYGIYRNVMFYQNDGTET